MTKYNNTLTQDRLKELLKYNPTTGIFTRVDTVGGHPAGSIAGWVVTTHSGKKYRNIEIDARNYCSHRLVWLYVHGEFPKSQIDHEDGDGLNNRIDNLRSVTGKENSENQRLRSNNKSGHMGVFWLECNKKWWAYIDMNRKRINLGYYTDKNDAITARKAAEQKLGYHPNHGSVRPL